MSPRALRPAALIALPLAALALAGCSISGAAVPKAETEKQISSVRQEQVSQKPDSIDCPDDLPAKVGATMTCVLSAGGETIDVHVTVNKVEGEQVGFDAKVADEAN